MTSYPWIVEVVTKGVTTYRTVFDDGDDARTFAKNCENGTNQVHCWML